MRWPNGWDSARPAPAPPSGRIFILQGQPPTRNGSTDSWNVAFSIVAPPGAYRIKSIHVKASGTQFSPPNNCEIAPATSFAVHGRLYAGLALESMALGRGIFGQIVSGYSPSDAFLEWDFNTAFITAGASGFTLVFTSPDWLVPSPSGNPLTFYAIIEAV